MWPFIFFASNFISSNNLLWPGLSGRVNEYLDNLG